MEREHLDAAPGKNGYILGTLKILLCMVVASASAVSGVVGLVDLTLPHGPPLLLLALLLFFAWVWLTTKRRGQWWYLAFGSSLAMLVVSASVFVWFLSSLPGTGR